MNERGTAEAKAASVNPATGERTLREALARDAGPTGSAIAALEACAAGETTGEVGIYPEEAKALLAALDGTPQGIWLPTSENVNALPEPVRRYIADLEMRCDPAGDVRELTIARDTVRALELRALDGTQPQQPTERERAEFDKSLEIVLAQARYRAEHHEDVGDLAAAVDLRRACNFVAAMAAQPQQPPPMLEPRGYLLPAGLIALNEDRPATLFPLTSHVRKNAILLYSAAAQPQQEPDAKQGQILACPFCGLQPRTCEDDSYGSCGVLCVCEPEPGVSRPIGKLDEAIEVWNRRAVAHPAQPEQEQ